MPYIVSTSSLINSKQQFKYKNSIKNLSILNLSAI